MFPIMEYRLALSARAQLNKDASQMSEAEGSMLRQLQKILTERQGAGG